MLRLRNRNKCPINGFQYFQPETGREFTEWSFSAICEKVQADRQANPRFNLTTDRDLIESEIDYVNALRMSKVQGGEEYIADPTASVASPVPNPKASAPQFLHRVGQVAAGAVALVDWIKDRAEAVPPEKAYHRASVCVTCPMNDKKADLLDYFTIPASEAIRAAISLRSEWKLETPFDDLLNVCSACSCPIKLKLWLPLDKILSKMNDETKAGLHANCWITKTNG